MPRERMVTRTIASAIVKVKVYLEDTDEIKTVDVTVTGVSDKEQAFKAARTQVNRNLKQQFLKALSYEKTEKLYAMKETDFLKYAVEIQPGDTKVPDKEPEEPKQESESKEETESK